MENGRETAKQQTEGASKRKEEGTAVKRRKRGCFSICCQQRSCCHLRSSGAGRWNKNFVNRLMSCHMENHPPL